MHNKLIKTTLTLSLSFLLSLLVACGGANKALISTAEIDTARRAGSLENLYQKASGLVARESGSSKKQAIELRSKIARLLVEDKSAQVSQLVAQYQQSPETVDRAAVLSLKQAISGMQQWSATDYTRESIRLNKIQEEIDGLVAAALKSSQQENISTVAKMLSLSQAARLTGRGQPEYDTYEKAKANALAQFMYQGEDALAKRLYSIVIKSAEKGLTVDPGNVRFESMLSQGQAGLFEKDFQFALENGKAESAYQSLLAVADKPIFLQLKKSMSGLISVLSGYFADSAAKAYKKGDLATAYNNFRKGRIIQDKLGISNKGFIQEKRFLDLLMVRAKRAETGLGVRQTLMRIVDEFDPDYPGLKSAYLKVSDEVKSRAMTKLSVADFKEVSAADAVVASVGRRVSSKLEKLLFQQLGNEVLVVTSTQTRPEKQFEGLALKIDGEILQAAIERSSNQGQRAQNVQTAINKTETEEYKKWSKRKRGEAPTQYHETPIIEEVVLKIEHIRKQAVAEVAFRIIEPATGKILLTDSIVKESEFSGESINEYQKGLFHQPYVRAELPSDIKIMDNLASELADQLGKKLGDYLQNPEQVFHHKYVEAKAQANNRYAIELLANAVSIAESKGADFSDWYEELKTIVLQ